MADGEGEGGGVVDFRTWNHVSAIYYSGTKYQKSLKDKTELVKYWVSLKKGGLIECEEETDTFANGFLANDAILKIIPIIRVKGKPFLPSGDLNN